MPSLTVMLLYIPKVSRQQAKEWHFSTWSAVLKSFRLRLWHGNLTPSLSLRFWFWIYECSGRSVCAAVSVCMCVCDKDKGVLEGWYSRMKPKQTL